VEVENTVVAVNSPVAVVDTMVADMTGTVLAAAIAVVADT